MFCKRIFADFRLINFNEKIIKLKNPFEFQITRKNATKNFVTLCLEIFILCNTFSSIQQRVISVLQNKFKYKILIYEF